MATQSPLQSLSTQMIAETALRMAESSRVKTHMAVQVLRYHNDPNDPQNSFVEGIDFFSKNANKVFVKLNENSKSTVSIAGFQNPIESEGKTYNVPIKGIILFDDVTPIPSLVDPSKNPDSQSYSAAWARSSVRVKNQSIALNYTTVRVSDGAAGKPPAVIFDSYSVGRSTVVDLSNHSSAMQELETAIINALDPNFGLKGNTSLSLLRIHSENSDEDTFCQNIDAFRNNGNHVTGAEAFAKFKNSEQGKLLLDFIAKSIVGQNYKAEITPGVRYFLSPNIKKQFLIESTDNPDKILINPRSFLGGLAKQLRPTEKVEVQGKWVPIVKPRLMEMFLNTSTLDDGGKLVTSFTPKTSKTPIVDFASLPSKAIPPKPEAIVEHEQINQQAEEAELRDDPHNNIQSDDEFDELSAEDLESLAAISQSLKM